VPFSTTMFEISPSPVRAVMATWPEMSVPGVGDELLGAVDDPLAVLERGSVRTLPASEPPRAR
jgi:hypothetical protein